MSDHRSDIERRRIIKVGAALGVATATPIVYTRNAWTAKFRNNPGDGESVTLGFNVP